MFYYGPYITFTFLDIVAVLVTICGCGFVGDF